MFNYQKQLEVLKEKKYKKSSKASGGWQSKDF